MGSNGTHPALIFASAVTVVVAGSFLLVVHVEVSGREAVGIRPYYKFSGEPTASSAVSPYFSDFKRGKQIIENKRGDFMAGFFGASAPAERASGQAETANREAPLEKYEASYSYKSKFQEDDYTGNGSEARQSFWSGMGGGGSAAGGSVGAGFSNAIKNDVPANNSKEPAGAGPPERKAPPSVSRGIFGGVATRDGRAAAPKLSASLSGKNTPQKAGPNPGGQPGAGGAFPGYGDQKLPKGGGLSGMPGQRAGASLDGAAESMKTAAQSSYNSKMSGGAAAAASGSGSSGGLPSAVSASQQISAGRVAVNTSAGAGDKAKNTASDAGTGAGRYGTYGAAYNAPDLLASVLKEKLNGMDTKYVSEQEAADAPDEKLLKAGGIADDPDTKSFSGPDPEDLNSLSDKRTTELKKELHVFMARVENKYGKMTDLYRASCTLAPDICKAGGISGSYLAMTTANGAKLVFGLKHVAGKWRLYTVDFTMPEG